MKRLAFIAARFLPVPAVRGGAVECLTTFLIEENEKHHDFDIDVYTSYHKDLERVNYKHTKIIPVIPTEKNWFDLQIGRIGYVFAKYLNLQVTFTKYAKTLKKILNTDNYDYVVFENSMENFVVMSLKKHTKDNLYYHMHNDLEGAIGDKTPTRAKYVIKYAKKIFTCSKYIKERLDSLKDSEKVSVLYNCIDSNAFNFKLKAKTTNQNEYVFMLSGRMQPEKGVLELVSAFSKALEIKSNIKLLIVGNAGFLDKSDKTPYEKEIETIVKKNPEKYILTGFVKPEEMYKYYEMADVIMVPTLNQEPFGLVGVEAMAMGKPIVSTCTGGLAEYLYDSFTIKVSVDNIVADLYKVINDIASNQYDLISMGTAAKEAYETNSLYTRENYYQQFKKLICEE